MNSGQLDLAGIAALIGEPARARMLSALMSGMALTATELALEAGIAPSTASVHLAKCTRACITAVEQQGRHRFYRLYDHEIAEVIEALQGAAATRGPTRLPGPTDAALRRARVCYDHLAGELGVWLLGSLRFHGLLGGRDGLVVTPAGAARFARIGVDVEGLAEGRRPLCRTCLDWSERRHHLAGALGAAILAHCFAQGWARRERGSRAVVFNAAGERALRSRFGN